MAHSTLRNPTLRNPTLRNPIVVAPGLLCTPDVFAMQLPDLWTYGVTSIADTLSDDNFSDMARRLLSDAPDSFTLIGLSMGGYLAFEVLRQAPQRVNRLVLLDTSARSDTSEQTQLRIERQKRAETDGIESVAREMYPQLVSPDNASDPELENLFVEMAQVVGVTSFIRQQNAIMTRVDSRPDLAQIHVPTLVVVGELDRSTPLEVNQEIASGISGSTFRVIPGAGHLSPLETPGLVTDVITDWLS